MDGDFLLPHDTKLKCLSPFNIRPDPSFPPQFYFMDFQEMGSEKFGLYFFHLAAASPNESDQSVRTVAFLKRKFSIALGTRDNPIADMNFAVDERAAKLYISFGNDVGGPETKLRVMDIEFDSADHLGYRRVRVRQDRLFVVRICPPMSSLLGAIKICPITGNLFGQYSLQPTNTNNTYKSVAARFEDCKAHNSLIRARISDHKFTFENSARNLDRRASMFTKLNHLLILFGFGQEDKPQTNELMFFLSYDSDLNLVRSLAFNPAEFVNQFFPANVMLDFYDSRRPFSSESHAVGSCFDLVGHTLKYVLFSFDRLHSGSEVARDWYTRKNLPPVQCSRVIDLRDLMDGNEYREIYPMPMGPANTHLYLVCRLEGKPNEMRRLSLSLRFKDYRHCANCGEIEKRKRRNKEGKRIAKFKVCRLCKKKNFHLFYLDSDIECHYCSDECVKQHWKTHKTVHKRSKLNRTTTCAKTVEETF